ncbi:MAG: sulfatase [Planctomycetota bacterium]
MKSHTKNRACSNSTTRRDFLRTVAAGAAALALPGCTASPGLSASDGPAGKPNFVFFLIDDMGWTDVGCYGSSFYETPNIDKLASEQWIGARQRPTRYVDRLELEELTIAEVLQRNGYATGFVGKWHLAPRDSDSRANFYPDRQGFEVNIAGNHWGAPATYFYPYQKGKRTMENMPPGGKPGEYLTDRLTDESLKFLEANKDRPFLLYLSHYAVHGPLQSKQALTDKYKAKAERLPEITTPAFVPERDSVTRQVQDHPVFAGMVESVDQSVGRVLNKLDELSLAENTIVIFMSDNGGMSTRPKKRQTATSNLPLRAGKGWLYEGGIREPMIIKWPGVVKPGGVCSEPVTSTDFYPTMLDMTSLPLIPKQHIDGVSLLPLLKNQGKLKRNAIYWHYPHYHGSGNRPSGAIRAGHYKLIEWYENDRIELYNLKDDIGEKHDLSTEMPAKAAELRKMLHTWRRAVNAQMPAPNENGK